MNSSTLPLALRGQWVVALRDIPGNDEELVGPFHSEDKAEAVARRLRGDIEARGAAHVMEAIVRWVRAGLDLEEMRDEMLRDLDAMGYEFPHPAPGGAFGSWKGSDAVAVPSTERSDHQ